MSSLRLKGISKTYEREVLKPVDLVSEENEFITVVGPSGCGKSTLLRCIAGLETPTTGDVIINDRTVNEAAPGKRNIAMVFQSYALYPNINVFKNIAFPLKSVKMKKAEIRKTVYEVAEKLDISGILWKKPSCISGGERQRVAIAKAMVRKPDVFLFDEPLANLDVNLRAKARNEFANLHKTQNAVFIYVTHDQEEAMALGNRILVMNDGKIQQFDYPQNIYMNPNNRFVAEFVGNPKINFVSKTVYEKLTGGKVNADFFDKNDYGIRPEKIKISVDPANCNASIKSVEIFGGMNVVKVIMDDEEIAVCVDIDNALSLKEGDRVYAFSSKKDFLVFDKQTGSACS